MAVSNADLLTQVEDWKSSSKVEADVKLLDDESSLSDKVLVLHVEAGPVTRDAVEQLKSRVGPNIKLLVLTRDVSVEVFNPSEHALLLNFNVPLSAEERNHLSKTLEKKGIKCVITSPEVDTSVISLDDVHG